MDQQTKERWCAALESGEYEQGDGFLNREGKFCCLGVLCEVHPDVTWREDRDSSRGSKYAIYGEDENHALLPNALVFALELEGEGVPIDQEIVQKVAPHYGHCDTLTALNDQGADFSTIAKVIREAL